MSWPIVFHIEVQEDVDGAFDWYEEQRDGLGPSFSQSCFHAWTPFQKTPIDLLPCLAMFGPVCCGGSHMSSTIVRKTNALKSWPSIMDGAIRNLGIADFDPEPLPPCQAAVYPSCW